ncbi:ABC-three component system middle component 5 [Asticcacaulis sp.]|uniref:ABC-three component system middle component 5 n=1 Tax=Asticcacaulis sp. TaxID=1872648 RepID=UPI0026068246|nr:ABC-three component system middle component 5 [Asticcacaulis sp.]
MIQLSYQAAFDPYHAAFRLLRLAVLLESAGAVTKTAAKIIDFFILFPFRIDEITFTQKHRKFKRLAKKYAYTRPYGLQPSPRAIFQRMTALQDASIDTLTAHGYLDVEAANRDLFRLGASLPQDLRDRIEAANAHVSQKELVEFVLAISEYPVPGPSGLKARSGLMEYRYDAL